MPPRTPSQVRAFAVRASLVLTATIALLLYFTIGREASLGFIYGGAAGTAGFWMLARKVEQFASMSPVEVQAKAMKWSLVRMLIYGLALYQAYLLDKVEYHGLVAGVAGIMVIRLVMIWLAFARS